MEEAGVFIELADEQYVLLVLPLLKDNQSSPFREIIQRLNTINWAAEQGTSSSPLSKDSRRKFEEPKESTLAISYDAMNETPRVRLSLSEACGKISAETIIPYPPGVPLIQRGEVITYDMVQKCISLLNQGAKIQGGIYLDQQQIQVFE